MRTRMTAIRATSNPIYWRVNNSAKGLVCASMACISQMGCAKANVGSLRTTPRSHFHAASPANHLPIGHQGRSAECSAHTAPCGLVGAGASKPPAPPCWAADSRQHSDVGTAARLPAITRELRGCLIGEGRLNKEKEQGARSSHVWPIYCEHGRRAPGAGARRPGYVIYLSHSIANTPVGHCGAAASTAGRSAGPSRSKSPPLGMSNRD
jgi:hypothetical protein